ncbi:hypothetical protein [Marinoscillum furvescens]|uniref:DNA polymerase-3 subunit gamma/tau n=1 Tax=Marinoscillum furvescens DSM 4134 TaxID=1122208 RepID=A0A3D9LIE1_MARFU|nr:hypothetical protein [Marinoscillum furvescens]REE05799.1 hypothetical protein C7460_101318 [Marinoscillum furvescens DSM 4134]
MKKPVLEEKTTPFDDQLVKITWEAFKSHRISNGATDTEKLVLDRVMEKSGEHNIKILMESPLEASILDKFEADVIQFFRKKLSNTLIQMEREVREPEHKRQLYTSKEKYEYMSEQNPALRELKERLGLDFEY